MDPRLCHPALTHAFGETLEDDVCHRRWGGGRAALGQGRLRRVAELDGRGPTRVSLGQAALFRHLLS